MKRFLLTLTLVVGVWPGSAHAAIIFSDNFDLENGSVDELNYNGFANFTVQNGVVDLIGTGGSWDFLPGNGKYVDLDGSGSHSGIMTAKPRSLGAGSYNLLFDLAGSHRDSTEGVNIRIFGGLNSSYGLLDVIKYSSDPFSTIALAFTLSNPDTIQFAFNNSGDDHIGALLDNVRIDQLELATVPEPGSLVLLGSGLVYLGRRLRRRRVSPN